MNNLNIPTEIINNIKTFIPRDRDMKHPLAKIFRKDVNKWCYLVPQMINKSYGYVEVDYESVKENEEQWEELRRIILSYYKDYGQ